MLWILGSVVRRFTQPRAQLCRFATHRGQREEGYGEDGEAGRDDLAHPSPGHRVAVPDRRHCYLERVKNHLIDLRARSYLAAGKNESNLA